MKKNVVVVGYGGMGSWHAEHIRKSDVVSLSGIFDVKERRILRARENGIRAYSSFEEVLNDKSVDIISVCSTNENHKETTIKALLAGKNVICEKPVTMTVEDFDEMVQTSKRTGKLFSVHQNRRWDEDFIAIKSLAESGEIGELINIESRVHGSRGIPGDWRGKKEFGGGMILDWGVHLIDQILCIFKDDRLRSVYCATTHITNEEVDDGFKLSLAFQSGKTAYVEVGTYNFISLPRFYMQCRGGSAIINGWTSKPHIAKAESRGEDVIEPVKTAAGITKTMAPRDEFSIREYDMERPVSDVHDYYRNFCAAIEGKAELAVKLCEVRRCLQVIEAAFESAAGNKVINTDI